MAAHQDTHDAIVVGASLAGCTTAILLARAGASVLLVDQRPEIDAFKTVCGHYIQASALPTMRRLDIYEPMMAAGAVHSPAVVRWSGDTIGPVSAEKAEASINLPRKKLDPLIRRLAAETPGVEPRLGWTLRSLSDLGTGIEATFDSAEGETVVTAKTAVGADGRNSTVAKQIGAREVRSRNGRFNYSPFYSGPPHADFPGTTAWFNGDQWSGAFPTSDGLTGYYLMPTHDRLPEFKADLEGACLRMIAEIPGAPPVDQLKLAGPIVGRVDMTNIWRNPVKGNVALAGDAALSIDPLYGVGCGWALQSGELLADALAGALTNGESAKRALKRYRRKVVYEIYSQTLSGAGYSRGRELSAFERFVMRRAARDPVVEEIFIRILTRSILPFELLGPRRTFQLLRA